MGQLVKLVKGVWGRHGQGVWKFDVDHVEAKYDVAVRENESFDYLMEMAKKSFVSTKGSYPQSPYYSRMIFPTQ